MLTYLEKLAALRAKIAQFACDGFLVPSGDEYQSEYVGPASRRIEYLTGFTGSAGTLLVLKDKALLFVDGRYTLQAARQVQKDLFTVFDIADKSPLAWLEENAEVGQRIAYDPWLHSAASVERLHAALKKKSAFADPIDHNFVDKIWKDRPAAPETRACPYDLTFAGKSSADKRREVAAVIKEKGCDAAVVSDVSSIAWLLNVRGEDERFAPVVFSRAILMSDATVEWFIDPAKESDDLHSHVGPEIFFHPPDAFPKRLEKLAYEEKKILIDPEAMPSRISDILTMADAKLEKGEDPCALPRAVKNKTEQAGMRKAHFCDGAALVNFLAWLDAHWEKENLTELDAQKKLEEFHKRNPQYRGPSFEVISAAGENSALIHYTASPDSNAPLKRGQLYLTDSGGQYCEGTTDVTRTVALGEPSLQMRENFTRVLKGHIALASIRFPEGTSGSELDAMARQYLWSVGRDYNHGTGHGVGNYLGVHEGPQAISKRGKTPLQAGMVVSNEPGYYEEGAYGIRIENLQMVVEVTGMAIGKRKLLGFETLTLAPIDLKLIDPSLMSDAELSWLNAYHERVRRELSPALDQETAKWLDAATKPIGR